MSPPRKRGNEVAKGRKDGPPITASHGLPMYLPGWDSAREAQLYAGRRYD